MHVEIFVGSSIEKIFLVTTSRTNNQQEKMDVIASYNIFCIGHMHTYSFLRIGSLLTFIWVRI